MELNDLTLQLMDIEKHVLPTNSHSLPTCARQAAPHPHAHLMGSWSSLSSLLCAIRMPLFLARGHPERLRRSTGSARHPHQPRLRDWVLPEPCFPHENKTWVLPGQPLCALKASLLQGAWPSASAVLPTDCPRSARGAVSHGRAAFQRAGWWSVWMTYFLLISMLMETENFPTTSRAPEPPGKQN